MTAATIRLALKAAGFTPVACIGKEDVMPGWRTLQDATPEQIARWPGGNSGINTSDTPCIDDDILHPDAAAAVEEYIRDWFDGRGTILVRFGQLPKRAVLFRTSTPFPKMVTHYIAPDGTKGHKIEILCDGQQVIVDGIHPDTNEPYSWHGGYAPGRIKREELPEIDEQEARELLGLLSEMLAEKFGFQQTEAPGHGGNGHDASGATVERKAVEVLAEIETICDGATANAAQTRIIPSLLRKGEHPQDVLNYVVDATMEMAARHGLGWTREAEVKDVTSRILSGYNNLLLKDYDPATGVIPSWLPGEFHERWIALLNAGRKPAFNRNGGGFHLRSYGPGHAAGNAGAKPSGSGATGNTTGKPGTASSGPPPRQRFKLVAFADMHLGNDPLYRVDDLIPIRGLVDLWGKAKCCKSFWAYDLCFHIAMGWEYRDRYVQQGTVIYCAFEGAHGYKKRKEALLRHYNIERDANVPLYLIAESVNLIIEHKLLVSAISEQLGKDKPAVVVLDTLNKSLVGSENKDVDMGAYVRAAEAIRDTYDCVVIIVHHCGYDETRPRGHSSLPAAVDAQLAVTREGNVVTVTVEMMRDGPEETQIVSEVKQIEVGTDKHGKVLTSLVVVPSDAEGQADRVPGPRSLVVFHDALRAATREHGVVHQPTPGELPVRAAAQAHVRSVFYATYTEAEDDPAKRQDKLKHAFSRSLKAAQERKLIGAATLPNGQCLIWMTGQYEQA